MYYIYHSSSIHLVILVINSYRMTLLFFCLSGLDVLNSLDLTESKKKEIIDWIYAQQILPDPSNGNHTATAQRPFFSNIVCFIADSSKVCGFRGSSFLGIPFSQVILICCPFSFIHSPHPSSHINRPCTPIHVTVVTLL